MRAGNGKPSTGNAFISSMNYALRICGYRKFADVVSSRRIKGAGGILFTCKNILRQAPALSVSQVLQLHRALENESLDVVDRALVAYTIVALYTRRRHSDLQPIDSVEHDWNSDGGFVEMRTVSHKTGRSARAKTTFLPLVAPAVGVNGRLWPELVEQAFNAAGLQFRGVLKGPLFRPPSTFGGLCKRGLTSEESSGFLRSFFDETSDEKADRSEGLSSHSLKVTCLSWAAKYGMDIHDRNILGRHSSVVLETNAVYSRDLAVRAVMKLQGVIRAISKGAFAPDQSRSGYFPKAPSGDVAQQQVAPLQAKVELIGDSPAAADPEGTDQEGLQNVEAEETSPRSDSESSEIGATSEEDLAVPVFVETKRPRRSVIIKDGAGESFKHKSTRTVHVSFLDVRNKGWLVTTFAWGRSLTQNYERTSSFDSSFMRRLCKLRAEREMILEDLA